MQTELSLDRWANFYLATSTAAATLIGLLFVVITIAAERSPPEDVDKIRLYLTPTVVLFGSVLGVATVLMFPNHTRLSASICVGLVGLLGWTYQVSLLVRRGGERHTYAGSEPLQFVVLPIAADSLLVAGAVLLLQGGQHALTFVAAGMLSLLTLAIRNSWAIAVDVVSTPPGPR